MWGGADPGGINCFGVAQLFEDGRFTTRLVSSVDAAVGFFGQIEFLGIDCPMWWSSAEGGGRLVDANLRRKYRIASGTIQSVNSLRGAAVVQGVLLAMRLREKTAHLAVTETHPKALLMALNITGRGKSNKEDWKKPEIWEKCSNGLRYLVHRRKPNTSGML